MRSWITGLISFLLVQNGGEGQESKPVPPVAATGTIVGVVKFEGTPPPNARISMTTPECSACHKGDVYTEEILVRDGRLKNVLVYLKIKGKWNAPPGSVLLDQVGCIYQPHVVVLRTGQTLVIRNSDDATHDISIIGHGDQSGAQSEKGMLKEVRFANPEVGIPVRCRIHNWMGAWLHVMKHPYYALTGSCGTFRIENVPIGEYTLVAWHEADPSYGKKIRAREEAQNVRVEAGNEATVEFLYEPIPPK